MRMQFQTNGQGAVRIAVDLDGKEFYQILEHHSDLAHIAAQALDAAAKAHKQTNTNEAHEAESKPPEIEPTDWSIHGDTRSGYAGLGLSFGAAEILLPLTKQQRLKLINMLVKVDEDANNRAVVEQPEEFVKKAHSHLNWAAKDLALMVQVGAENEVSLKALFNALTSINVAAEAILDTCHELRLDSLKRTIEDARRFDPLLSYLLKARNTDVHQVIRWTKSIAHYVLIFKDAEAEAAAKSAGPRALEDLFREAFANGEDQRREPNKEVFAARGIDLTTLKESVALHGFNYWEPKRAGIEAHIAHMPAPTSHLGKPLPSSALTGIRAAITYYSSHVQTLAGKLQLTLDEIILPLEEIEWQPPIAIPGITTAP